MEAILNEEMSRIEKLSIELKSSLSLMEEAGKRLSDVVKELKPSKVLLLVGKSGNGGDALVLGRYLMAENISVDAFIPFSNLSFECKTNKDLFKGHIFNEICDFSSYDILIDGFIGTGLNRDLSSEYIEIFKYINSLNKRVISIDIPSGINAYNGMASPIFIKSYLNISIMYHKIGLFLNDGLDSYANLELIDIGIEKTNNLIPIISKDITKIIPTRMRNSNKSTFKTASVIGGSVSYSGAPMLSFNALLSLKMGVGYSRLYVPKSLYDIVILRYPEVIVKDLEENNGFYKYNEEELVDIMNKSDSISIGMGMGVSLDLYNACKYLITNYEKILIIDADALNSISKYGVKILENPKAHVIITPHPKELSRLINIDTFEILKNPINIVRSFVSKYNVTLILKGPSTIVANKNELRLNITGNSGLAKGGSGDVLSGILTGLGVIDRKTIDIASLGVYLLGKTADNLLLTEKEETITPSEIINSLNKTFFDFTKS